MSLLTVLKDAARELGIAVPTSIVGSEDVTAVQLLAIAKASIERTAKRADWQELQTAYTFVAFASASTSSYSLPSDFDRFIQDTWWDDTNNRPLIGPRSPQDWKALRKGSLSGNAGVYTSFRVFGNRFHVEPIETSASAVFAFDYISTNRAESSAGTAKSTFTADGDTVRAWPEDLLQLDVIWRFKKAKGLAYADELNEFERQLELAIGRDGGKTVQNANAKGPFGRHAVNIPESDFPSS